MRNRILPFDTIMRYASSAPEKQEYDEARASDIDPQTFDKATYTRLRSNLEHDQVMDAMSASEAKEGFSIPQEYIETALKNQDGDYELARAESMSYIDRDRAHIAFLGRVNETNPAVLQTILENHTLSPPNLKSVLTALINHHTALRDRKPNDDIIEDTTDPSVVKQGSFRSDEWAKQDYKRAHEWILSELKKLDPKLEPKLYSPQSLASNLESTSSTPELPCFCHNPSNQNSRKRGVHSVACYDRLCNYLAEHYAAERLSICKIKQHPPSAFDPYTAQSIFGQYTANRRKQEAVSNISQSCFFPYGYSPDRYEE